MKYAKQIKRKNHIQILDALYKLGNEGEDCKGFVRDVQPHVDMTDDQLRHAIERMALDTKILKRSKLKGYKEQENYLYEIDADKLIYSEDGDWYSIEDVTNEIWIKYINIIREHGPSTRTDITLHCACKKLHSLKDMESAYVLLSDTVYNPITGKMVKRYHVNDSIVWGD